MTNNIRTPEAVLKAKGTFHLIKTDNKILVALFECLLFIPVYYGSLIALGMVLGLLAGLYQGFTGSSLTLLEISSQEWFIPIDLSARVLHTILITLFCIVYQKRKMVTLGYTKKGIFSQYLTGLVAGLVIFSAGVGIAVVTGAASVSVNHDGLNVPLYLAFIVGWFFQGMSEEIMCRGYLLVSMSRKLPVPVAVLLSSLAFACIHLGNNGLTVLAFINLTLFGIFAGAVFLRTGNIWLVSAIHSVWNFAQGNIYGILVSGGFTGPRLLNTVFEPSKEIINGGDFGLEGGLAVTIVLVIGTLITVFFPKISKDKTANA